MAMRVSWLKDLRLKDLEQVGGKNASLGEMIGALAAAGIRVPGGFATTADAFREATVLGREGDNAFQAGRFATAARKLLQARDRFDRAARGR